METVFADRLKASMRKVHAASPVRSSPLRSPSSRDAYYDRFIPSRASSTISRKRLFGAKDKQDNTKQKETNSEIPKPEALAFEAALVNELLEARITEIPDTHPIECSRTTGQSTSSTTPYKENVVRFMSSPSKLEWMAPYYTSPISSSSARMLLSPRRMNRKIPKTPFKVLDAPELQDDYYLNLLDWSVQNILAVGLGSAVYLWNASTCQVSKLCDLEGERNTITSVTWSEKEHHLAVGTNAGYVQIWDAAAIKRLTVHNGHTGRVGSLAWNEDFLCTGSRDHHILQWDPRLPSFPVRRLLGHVQEVCGLKWSPDGQHLASGGNDNKLLIWPRGFSVPLHSLTEHNAAVKALAWSPHQHGLIASGGGTADRTIKFWNVLTGSCLQSTDTGSQVCNLAWSKSSSELVSTHGYSQNQIIIWRYPSLMQVAKLTGHTTRVLFLAMSPDGQTIVTGAGDETLRFWNVFAKSKSLKDVNSSTDLVSYIR